MKLLENKAESGCAKNIIGFNKCGSLPNVKVSLCPSMESLKDYGKSLAEFAKFAIVNSIGFHQKGHALSSRYSTTVKVERDYYAFLATHVTPLLMEIASMMQIVNVECARHADEACCGIRIPQTTQADGKTKTLTAKNAETQNTQNG